MKMNMGKAVLLTGASGFTGGNVLNSLVAEGWNVHLLVRSASLNKISFEHESVTLHAYDGSIASVTKAMSIASPEIVIHIASLVVGDHDKDILDDLIASNVLLGTQLLEVMVEKEVKNFINTGTYWEYYEGIEYNPVGLYAATKYAFQNILQYYVEAKDINAITLKLFDAYGPNDPRPKLMNLLLDTIATGEPIELSPGKQKIDLVYIDDVVQAFLVATERLVCGQVEGHEVYGVGTQQLFTLQEVVGVIEGILGKRANVCWGARAYRDREVMQPCQHLSILPGWKAKVNLEQGVRNILLSGGKLERGGNVR